MKLALRIVLQRICMKKEKKIALFVSGKGSNARAVIDFSCVHGGYEVAALYASNPHAAAIDMAKELGVHTDSLSDTDLSGEKLLGTLNAENISLIVLAGFLRKIPASFIKGFHGKMINIHPSLLPAHGGAGMYGIHVHRAVLEAGDKQSGCTIHYVDEGYDTGAIIAQKTCVVPPNDTPESLAERVLKLEHDLLPRTIAELVKHEH